MRVTGTRQKVATEVEWGKGLRTVTTFRFVQEFAARTPRVVSVRWQRTSAALAALPDHVGSAKRLSGTPSGNLPGGLGMAGKGRDYARLAVVATMAVAFCVSGPTVASQRARLLDAVGSINVAALEADQEAEVLRYLATHGPSLGIPSTEGVRSSRIASRSEASYRISVLQKHRGLPVIGASMRLSVSRASGEVSRVRSSWQPVEGAAPADPVLTARQAQAIARGQFAYDPVEEERASTLAYYVWYGEYISTVSAGRRATPNLRRPATTFLWTQGTEPSCSRA